MKTLPLKIIILITLFFSINLVNAQLIVNAGNDTIVCGGSLQIGGAPTATGGTSPYTYVWETVYTDISGSFSASTFLDDSTIANPSLLPLAFGKPLTFKLTVTDALNNVVIDSSKVTIGPSSPITLFWGVDESISIGDSAQLRHNIDPQFFLPFTYQWSPNYKLSDYTLKNPWAKPDTTTTYYCITTTVSGCEVQTQVTVSVYPLAVTENELNKSIKFYPNPSSNHLIIENLGQQKNNVVIEIRSITGQLALLKNIGLVDKVTINTSQIPSGVYVVTVKDEQHIIATKKWVKAE